MNPRLMTAKNYVIVPIMAIVLCVFGGCDHNETTNANGNANAVRLGYFPNVTHAQALIGVSRGDFQKALGSEVKLEPQTFNAGPSVIEAVFAGHVDMAYIGPSPILNGFFQSKGEEVRVVAGSGTNGVLVIGNKKRGITKLEQLRGARVATPQLGNTQDISAKYYLTHDLGAKLKSDQGDTDVIPIANPDIETLFEKDQLDAAWVPEPWGTRIIDRGLAVLIEEEKNLWPEKSFPITNVIVRREFLEKHEDLVVKLLQAHIKITRELQQDPQSFAISLNDELKRLTSKALPPAVIEGALKYTGFDVDPSAAAFEKFFSMGKELGILKAETLDVNKLIVKEPLEKALKNLQSGDSADSIKPSAPASDTNTSNSETTSSGT